MSTTGTVRAVDTDQVARLAALVLETYSPAALDPGVTEPTIVTMPDGFRALVQHIEHTLAGPRESWESARSTPISRRLAVVRPRTAHG